MGCIGKLDGFVGVIAIVAVVLMSQDVPLLDGFLGFQCAEDILIKITKIYYAIVHYYGVGK